MHHHGVHFIVKREENKVLLPGCSLINYCLLNLMLTDPQRMHYLLLPTMESPINYHHCNLLIEDICSSEPATRCLVRPCSPACSLHQQYSTLWSRVIQRLQFSSVQSADTGADTNIFSNILNSIFIMSLFRSSSRLTISLVKNSRACELADAGWIFFHDIHRSH